MTSVSLLGRRVTSHVFRCGQRGSLEDLVKPLRDQRLPCIRGEPDRNRRPVDPAKLDQVRRLPPQRRAQRVRRTSATQEVTTIRGRSVAGSAVTASEVCCVAYVVLHVVAEPRASKPLFPRLATPLAWLRGVPRKGRQVLRFQAASHELDAVLAETDHRLLMWHEVDACRGHPVPRRDAVTLRELVPKVTKRRCPLLDHLRYMRGLGGVGLDGNDLRGRGVTEQVVPSCIGGVALASGFIEIEAIQELRTYGLCNMPAFVTRDRL